MVLIKMRGIVGFLREMTPVIISLQSYKKYLRI